MYKIGILTDNIKTDYNSCDLFEAGAQRAELTLVNPLNLESYVSNGKNLILDNGKLLNYLDALIVRRLNSKGDVCAQFEMLQRLQFSGVLLINSTSSLELSESKYLTSHLLSQFGLPVIDSLLTQNSAQVVRFALKHKEIVIKPAYSDVGTDVIRIKPDDPGKEAINDSLEKYGAIFAQRYVQSKGQDIRAFVIEDRVVSAMKRIANKGEWRTNTSLGAKAEKVFLSQKVRDIAVKATQIIGLDYTGVDLIEENGNFYVLEVNGSPSWQALKKATGRNIAYEIISMVIKKINEKYNAHSSIIS